MLPTYILAIFFAVVVFAYLVKGVVGFGEGLIATSLFLLFLDVKEVLPITLILALIGSVVQLARIWKEARKDVIAVFVLPIIVGVAAGTFLLGMIPGKTIKVCFAILLIIYALKLLVFPTLGRRRVGRMTAVITGIVSGTLDGLIGLGGVPLLIFLTNERLKKAVFRATTVALFFVLASSRLVAYSVAGLVHVDTITTVLVLVPAVIIGTLVGMFLHTKLDERVFKKVVAGMLLAIGMVLLL